MTLAERMKQRADKLNLTPLAIAAAVSALGCDVTARTVNDWLDGSFQPRFAALSPLATVLKVSLDWLIDGEGEAGLGEGQ